MKAMSRSEAEGSRLLRACDLSLNSNELAVHKWDAVWWAASRTAYYCETTVRESEDDNTQHFAERITSGRLW